VRWMNEQRHAAAFVTLKRPSRDAAGMTCGY
jgi:hypothetical protein